MKQTRQHLTTHSLQSPLFLFLPLLAKKNRERYRRGPALLGKKIASAVAGGPAPPWKKFRERYRREACSPWTKIRERCRKEPAPLGKKFASATPFGQNLASLPFLEKIPRLTAGALAPLEKNRERHRRESLLEKNSRALPPLDKIWRACLSWKKFAMLTAGGPAPLGKNRERYRREPESLLEKTQALPQGPPPPWKKIASATTAGGGGPASLEKNRGRYGRG